MDAAGTTIAAVGTPPGAGGVGIVRVSGPAAVAIAARVTRREPDSLIDRLLVHAVARAEDGERLDDVLVVVMRAPRSYTGEDVAELHGHGGALNVARLLAAVVAAGARPAEAGEFTRRAFANGRMDLTRAEAVADVIGAASERALRAAHAQLRGALGQHVERLRAQLVALLGEVEASIDFPEEDLSFLPPAEVAARAREIGAEVQQLAGSYGVGRALREGVSVALVGAPNAGKSSLFNALAGEERALVAADPGTTRDWVEARVVWSGMLVTLIDTAGEREAESELERRGVALGRARAEQADVVVRLMDVSAPAAGGEAREGGASAAAGDLVVWNKVDLGAAPQGALGVSAVSGAGLEALRAAVLGRALGERVFDEAEGEIVTSARHKALLDDAGVSLARAAEAAAADRPAELVAADLRAGASALGRIHGVDVGEELLDHLFARFCIGK